MAIDYEIIFGAFLIVIYATDRFNTPSTIRASTTAGRYYIASAVYLLIYLATFYIFTKSPQLAEFFNIDFSEIHASGIDPGESTTILVALLLSLLVPKIPVISEIDTRLRRYLHRLAAIPYEAIRLSKEIQHSRHEVPDDLRTALAQELEAQGFPLDEMDSDDPVIHDWIGITSLMTQLKSWDRSHQFSLFIQERSGQIERIKEHYARLNQLALNTVNLGEQAKTQPDMDALQDAAKNFRSNLQNEQRALLAEICDFISHGILKTCFRYGSRQRVLKEMGFLDVEKESELGLSVNQTVMLFGLLLALVLANFILFRPPNEDGERILLMIAMIVSIYSAAVICAVVPKQRWASFQYNDQHFYPTTGYMLSGLMAVAASALISLAFKTLIFASGPDTAQQASPFAAAWAQFRSDSYPWLTMSFMTTITTAFLIDWKRPAWLPERSRRFVDGTLEAAFLVAAATLVHWWLSSLSETAGFTGRVPDLASVLRTSAIVGFTLGFLVPTWYRATSDNSDQLMNEAPNRGQASDVNIHTDGNGSHSETAVIKRLRRSN